MIPAIKIIKETIQAPSRRIKARWTFNAGPPVNQLDEMTFQLDTYNLGSVMESITEFLAQHAHDTECDSFDDSLPRIQFHEKKSAMEFKLRFVK